MRACGPGYHPGGRQPRELPPPPPVPPPRPRLAPRSHQPQGEPGTRSSSDPPPAATEAGTGGPK